jgi:hypothetical protein
MKAKLKTIIDNHGGGVIVGKKLHVHFSAVYRWLAGSHRPGFDTTEKLLDLAHADGFSGIIWPARKVHNAEN